MDKKVELEYDYSIKVSSNILECNTPDLVYFEANNIENKYILIGECLSNHNYSSVSGNVIGTTIKNTLNGPKNFLIIKNDFKEKKLLEVKTIRNISKLSKEEINNKLEKYLNIKINLENIKNLIINCIDDEPYVYTENFNLLINYDNILELLDKLGEIYSIPSLYICVKSSNSENINKLIDSLGTYPNINLKILPNLYLLKEKDILINYLNLEENTEVIKGSDFNKIYNLLKKNRYTTDKLITVSGTGVLNPSIVNVRIGTDIKDILKEIKLKNQNLDFYLNGLMTGTKINPKDYIITNDIDSLIIMEAKAMPQEEKCINCGACLDICPVNLNPVMFKNKKYLEHAKNICINCNLCSYICPVYINFNKFLKGDKNE